MNFGPNMTENRHLEGSWRLFGGVLGAYCLPKLLKGSPDLGNVMEYPCLGVQFGLHLGTFFGPSSSQIDLLGVFRVILRVPCFH